MVVVHDVAGVVQDVAAHQHDHRGAEEHAQGHTEDDGNDDEPERGETAQRQGRARKEKSFFVVNTTSVRPRRQPASGFPLWE